MSPRRTRAAISGSAVSTRSRKKINNVDEDTAELIQQTRQSQRREKSLEGTAKQSARKKSSDAKVMLRKSARKKTSRRRLNLTQEAENENDFPVQNKIIDTNESIKIPRNKHNKTSTTEHIKHNLSQSNTSEDLDSNKMLNKKLQRKTAVIDAKDSSINVTPKSTPPKLSLTPHRSKKTPKKSPISLGSPKTHSITVPRLFKSPRKLSLLTQSEENLNKSDESQNEKLEKTKKDKLHNSSKSHKRLTPPVAQSKRRKSGIDLKTIVRKFSKSPKIVLRSPKSKKSKSRKLKLLSPSQKVRQNSLRTSNISSDISTTPDFDAAQSKIRTKKSRKEKNLSKANCGLIKTQTISQEKDMLTEPIVLLKRLSPERIQNMLTITNKIQSETSLTTRSPLINTRNSYKVLTTSVGSDISVNRNSNTQLQNSNVKKLTNRVSPRIKYNTLTQGKDRSSVPLISSTPREEKISLNMNLTFNTPIVNINEDNIFSIKSQRKNQSNVSNVMDKNTTIENISKSSLFENYISDASQFHISNVTKQDTTYEKDSSTTPEKKQENEKRNTYELEQPQTLSLRQMIKKRTSTDANLSSKENLKKTKVHFADEKFDAKNVNKSINNLSGSNISHNVNMQNNNIVNSAHKSRKVETPKFNQNSLALPFKTRSSPRTNIVTPRIQLNKSQVTPKPFTLMENKSEKKSSTKKVPNFGKIHEQMFAKSESLVDAKKRLQARHLAFSTKKILSKIGTKKEEKKPLPTDTKDGTHNRFGFKLRKNEATHVILKKQITFSRQKQQQETRMTLKGVRMNRRFELQMKARNLNP